MAVMRKPALTLLQLLEGLEEGTADDVYFLIATDHLYVDGSELRKDPRSRKVDNSGPVLRKVSSGFANNCSYRRSFPSLTGGYRLS